MSSRFQDVAVHLCLSPLCHCNLLASPDVSSQTSILSGFSAQPCPCLVPDKCPLCHAGMAQWVNCSWAAVNFFWDPPLSWVHFYGCLRRLTARCWFLYRSFSTSKVSTAASYLGTTSCSTSASISYRFVSKSMSSVFLRQAVIILS
jgi:hypothetical protein